MPLPIKRKYNVGDAVMLEFADTTREFFIQDKMDFTGFDPNFGDPYADNWGNDIASSRITPSDKDVDDELTILTKAVNDAVTAGEEKFRDTRHFIEKAFPDNRLMWNAFGYNDFDFARKSQPRFIAFLYKFHEVAERFKTKLLAIGYSQTKIDEILLLAKALNDANKEQEVFIGSIPVKTQDRIILLNKVWDQITEVCRVGKRIYRHDYARYNRYLLPYGEEAPENRSLSGRITDVDSERSIVGAGVRVVELDILVFSDDNGYYSFGLLPAGEYSLSVFAEGYESIIIEDVVLRENEPATRDIYLSATPSG